MLFRSNGKAEIVLNSMRNLRASLSGLVLLLQPALAFVWDVLFFQRPTTLVNWLGVVVASAAIYFGMAGRSANHRKVPRSKD
ncbi:MAG: hypothetical protein PVG15_07145 [Desulfobacterales bacterium]